MTNGNDAAYAHVTQFGTVYPGLTKREYFAAMCLQGILSTLEQGVRPVDIPTIASDAVLIADELIEALNK